MYSEATQGCNDHLLSSSQPPTVETIPSTSHLSLHDAAWIMPISRWRSPGRGPRTLTALHERNRLTRDFLDRVLETGE